MKRAIIVIAVLAVVGAGAGAYWYLNRPAETAMVPTFQVATVTRTDLMETVDAMGQVEAESETGLAFAVAGKVSEMLVAKGDTVTEGQVLARLDTTDLESAVVQAEQALRAKEIALAKAEKAASSVEVQTAQTKLESAQASYAELAAGPTEDELIIAAATLKKAETSLKEAQANYDKVAWRGGTEAMSESVALEQATIDYESALASYRQASQGPTESELKSAEAQVSEAQASLDELLEGTEAEDLELAQLEVEQAQTTLEDAEADIEVSTIVAPYDGTVTSVDIEPGQMATENSTVITLIDPSRVHVYVMVDELDLPSVQEGQKAVVTLDAFPDRELVGQVDLIAPSGTDESGVIAYEVSITFDQGDVPLRMGMTADVAIITSEEVGALLIPEQAVIVDEESGKSYALKLAGEDGRPARTEIQVGLESGTQVQVLSGLDEGDEVAVMTATATDSTGEPGFGTRGMFMFGGGGGPPEGGRPPEEGQPR
jgi:HlyD family secretion protein